MRATTDTPSVDYQISVFLHGEYVNNDHSQKNSPPPQQQEPAASWETKLWFATDKWITQQYIALHSYTPKQSQAN